MTQVLIIDDEISVRALIRQVLEAEGFHLREANDGEEGMQALQEASADLVITDIFMPNQEGIETIRMVRQQFPHTKLLAISGGGARKMMDVLPAAKQFGAHHTLTKPFTPDELLAAVTQALRG